MRSHSASTAMKEWNDMGGGENYDVIMLLMGENGDE